MKQEPDYYTVLGVAVDSQDVVIEAAYRALMQRYDDSRDASVNAAKKRTDISKAYAILGNPKSRAAYDKRRGYEPSKPPASNQPAVLPVPTEGQSNQVTAPNSRRSGCQTAAWIIGGLIAVIAAASALQTPTGQNAANNVMNVDENLTTTDMNATDINPTASNAADTNANNENAAAVDVTPPDLSRQPQSAVTYSMVEAAANWFTNTFKLGGFDGARSSSEQCHRTVQANPSWDAADRCAAFDYAAAYVDDLVSRGDRASTHPYFQFVRENEADNYASVGAPAYTLGSRLPEIRRAAEAAVAATIQAAARARAAQDQTNSTAQPTPDSSPQGSAGRVRVVPEGVFLNSETNLNNGTKLCRFDNGYERTVLATADCFYQ